MNDPQKTISDIRQESRIGRKQAGEVIHQTLRFDGRGIGKIFIFVFQCKMACQRWRGRIVSSILNLAALFGGLIGYDCKGIGRVIALSRVGTAFKRDDGYLSETRFLEILPSTVLSLFLANALEAGR